jgi:hypothetical protein
MVNDLALIDRAVPSDRLDRPVRFRISNDRYNMRTDPEILELNENEVLFTPIQGQHISATFVAGDTGTAVAESEDDTGRTWWLVIMNQMPDSQYPTIFYEGNNSTDFYRPVGWISSRFVEIMEE